MAFGPPRGGSRGGGDRGRGGRGGGRGARGGSRGIILHSSNLSELSLLHEQQSVPRVPSTLHPEHFSGGYALVDFDLFSPQSLSRSFLISRAPN